MDLLGVGLEDHHGLILTTRDDLYCLILVTF